MWQWINHKNPLIFNNLRHLIPFRSKSAIVHISRLMTNFLTKHAAGNKSGALLLTVFG